MRRGDLRRRPSGRSPDWLSHFLGIATSRFELPLLDGCSRAGNSHRTSGCDNRCGQPSSLNRGRCRRSRRRHSPCPHVVSAHPRHLGTDLDLDLSEDWLTPLVQLLPATIAADRAAGGAAARTAAADQRTAARRATGESTTSGTRGPTNHPFRSLPTQMPRTSLRRQHHQCGREDFLYSFKVVGSAAAGGRLRICTGRLTVRIHAAPVIGL